MFFSILESLGKMFLCAVGKLASNLLGVAEPYERVAYSLRSAYENFHPFLPVFFKYKFGKTSMQATFAEIVLLRQT